MLFMLFAIVSLMLVEDTFAIVDPFSFCCRDESLAEIVPLTAYR